MAPVYAKGAAELAWAGEEILISLIFLRIKSATNHGFDSFLRLCRPDENGGGIAVLVGNHVEHPMVTISEVDIGQSGAIKHSGTFGSVPAVSMTGWIIRGAIGFDFNNDSFQSAMREFGAEQKGSGF